MLIICLNTVLSFPRMLTRCSEWKLLKRLWETQNSMLQRMDWKTHLSSFHLHLFKIHFLFLILATLLHANVTPFLIGESTIFEREHSFVNKACINLHYDISVNKNSELGLEIRPKCWLNILMFENYSHAFHSINWISYWF